MRNRKTDYKLWTSAGVWIGVVGWILQKNHHLFYYKLFVRYFLFYLTDSAPSITGAMHDARTVQRYYHRPLQRWKMKNDVGDWIKDIYKGNKHVHTRANNLLTDLPWKQWKNVIEPRVGLNLSNVAEYSEMLWSWTVPRPGSRWCHRGWVAPALKRLTADRSRLDW